MIIGANKLLFEDCNLIIDGYWGSVTGYWVSVTENNMIIGWLLGVSNWKQSDYWVSVTEN